MTLYIKQNDIYTAVDRPYVAVNGVYTGVKEAYVKVAGTYRSAYLYDVTPPNPPEITLQLIEHYGAGDAGPNKLTGRYIKVGVRLPGASNDPDARLTRVLTNYPTSSETPPTTQFGGTYTQTPDNNYPGEPWSEWRYNSYGGHNDTSAYIYKQWTPNSTATSDLQNDKDYHFKGWALDNQGNWSVPTEAKIHVPKASVDASNVIVKEARFQANQSGRWKGDGFHSGDLVQQNSPRSRGLWFYGNQFTDSIGKQGTPTIRSAQIWIYRENDTGVANADIHLFWTKYGSVGALPNAGSGITVFDSKKIGTLAKGQGKWFDLPGTFKGGEFNTLIKGMGLDYKDYLKAAAGPQDYSVVRSVGEAMRCGEVHVVWEEKP